MGQIKVPILNKISLHHSNQAPHHCLLVPQAKKKRRKKKVAYAIISVWKFNSRPGMEAS